MPVVGGKLRLKGAGVDKAGDGQKKKRKKKSVASEGKDLDRTDSVEVQEGVALQGSSREGYVLPPRAPDADLRTPAEKKYDEHLKRTEGERVKKLVAKTHRERVKEFNEYLARLTEHYDIPKVGPG